MKVTNERAIELLKELVNDQHEAIYINDDEGGDVCGAYLEKAEALEMAIKALQNEKPQWILCTERLPEEKINPNTHDFEEVLCTTTWGDVRHYKYGKPIAHDKAHFWHSWGIMDEKVIAWKPLPDPYKEEANT